MFSYTSGTTGDPKGVKITHKMLLMSAACLNLSFGNHSLTEKDTYISYLPYSHIFEQAIFGMSVLYGMRIGYFSGDVL